MTTGYITQEDPEEDADQIQLRLGIQMRIFNDRLNEAVLKMGKPKYVICKELGWRPNYLGNVISMRVYPDYDKRLTLAVYLGVEEEEIFPEPLSEFTLVKQPPPFTIDAKRALSWLVQDDAIEGATENVHSEELMEYLLYKMADVLTDREQKVLRLRYGLDDDGRHQTLEEVSRSFGLTRERIRGIEQKALRKLRHHTVRKELMAAWHGDDAQEIHQKWLDDTKEEREAAAKEEVKKRKKRLKLADARRKEEYARIDKEYPRHPYLSNLSGYTYTRSSYDASPARVDPKPPDDHEFKSEDRPEDLAYLGETLI